MAMFAQLPDHGAQKAGILRQCVGLVLVTDTMSLQGARVSRERQVKIAVKGCGLHPKDFSQVNKIRQSKPDVPSFEECFDSERRDSSSERVYEQRKSR